MHFDLQQAVALAAFAPSALHVETEPARTVSSDFCRRQPRKKVPNLIKYSAISSGVAARSSADGRLVNDNHLIERILPLDRFVRSGPLLGSKPMTEKRSLQDVIHQGALARSTDAGHASHEPERNSGINVFKVVFSGAQNFDPSLFSRWRYSFLGNGNRKLA